MNKFKNQAVDVLAEALGLKPAFWYPGANNLGWSFHFTNEADLIINQSLSADYKLRLMKHLPAAFQQAGVKINITINDGKLFV